MGNHDANRELAAKDLADSSWKKTAQQTLATLTEGSPADFSQNFPELIIVPDGLFWYLPFDALQVPVNGELRSLAARFRLRYAPTVGLCVADAARPQQQASHGRGLGAALPATER